ncbi:MAG: Mut7-C ubiquitin/RNAse domain-containing protein [Chroococcidiopsidaceae cyanobacterium CP_BM_ER_R8_30]|nr:Mut7-C ubiquitin/RNAse domain-containing protein [Chroococcidiopsidaceae cyanobacterium CP_BM_ER_R8_30]
MATSDFRFYAELNDFLPPSRRQVRFTYVFEGRGSIKDMIESLGVPHTEVDLILVNGESVDFSYLVQDGDRIDVYPVSESSHITPLVNVRPKPLLVPRFVLDIHLGKLATCLRMLGFDTLYRNDYTDEELAQISSTQGRILLTRDRGVLMRSVVTHGYYVRATHPPQQVVEVLRRFNLFEAVVPFQRCLRCNGLLQPVSKETIIDQLQPQTQEYMDEFHRCVECGQIYWKGSHYERMQHFIEQVLRSKPVG